MARLFRGVPSFVTASGGVPAKALLLSCALAGPFVGASDAQGQGDGSAPSGQNPSPMVETTRSHERVPEQDAPGRVIGLDVGLPQPVRLFVPRGMDLTDGPGLLIHFHGPAYLAEHAAGRSGGTHVTATVNVGHGSGAYDAAFADPAVFDSLLAAARRASSDMAGERVVFRSITLSGFSAGHGAVRAILRDPALFEIVDAVLLLDGLHTGYVPRGRVLADGGRLDTTKLESIQRFARAAAEGEKRLLITHSEIFPGTFASTTETTDHLLSRLGLRRNAVLRWGPVGMQQLSEARCRGLEVQGYAGNSAPDHIDHIHGVAEFLRMLEELSPRVRSRLEEGVVELEGLPGDGGPGKVLLDARAGRAAHGRGLLRVGEERVDAVGQVVGEAPGVGG